MERKILFVVGICFLFTTSFFSGCINIPEELTQFSIMSFDVEPGIITQGDYANLSWVVLSASSVNIDNGIGNVALTGHRMIQPTETTTYTLTASNQTTTKNATVTIIVKPVQQNQTKSVSITDSVNDVSSIDYLTGETVVITSHTEIDVENIDITKAEYTQLGISATVSLQVKGNIENRGKIIDPESEDFFEFIDAVEYGFQLITSDEDYMISYSNGSGQLLYGMEQINLTSSDFSIAGGTLSITFLLVSADEVYEELIVTTTFIKTDFTALEEEGFKDFVYLSDICPNPSLEIIDIFAPSIGYVGKVIQFNASIQPLTGQPPYVYLWDFGDGDTSDQLNPAHVYTTTGIYIYTFTVTDKVGDFARETGIITIKA